MGNLVTLITGLLCIYYGIRFIRNYKGANEDQFPYELKAEQIRKSKKRNIIGSIILVVGIIVSVIGILSIITLGL